MAGTILAVAGTGGPSACSLVELISFGLKKAQMHPTSPHLPHYVTINEAQHFGKIIVDSVFCKVWFSHDCLLDIIKEVAVENIWQPLQSC